MRHHDNLPFRRWARTLLLACGLTMAGYVSQLAVEAAEPAGELAQRLAAVKFDQYATAPGYSEGPTWMRGEVFFCSGALLRVDAQRQVHKHLELGPAGTVLRGDGHLLICDNKHKALLDLAPDGTVGVVADQFEGRPLRSLNDLTIDARGNVYWTDPEGSTPQNPVGQVLRLRPDGRVDLMAGGLAFPNGLDIDPTGKFLYVIESQSKKILRYLVPADNERLGQPQLFYDLQGSGGDGCAFDAAGNLWVADFHRPETGQGRITVLSPDAAVLAYLPVPSKVVSNIAFGGPQHDEIFCTTGDPPGVFHAAVGVPGFKGHPGTALPIVRRLNVVVQRPHAEADTVRKIAAAAAVAKPDGDKLDEPAQQQIKSLVATVNDTQLRIVIESLLPDLGPAAARYQRDRALLAEIKRLGGKATVEVAAPDSLRAIAGDEALAVFGRIVEIELNERTDGHKAPEAKRPEDRVTDEWLKRLADQHALRRLELSGTAVTSAGLVHLRGLTQLERLNVCLTAVDDAGFEHLAGMTQMKRMIVCASKITGSGFQHLGGMKQLESINLHSSPASDAGLAAIGKLTSLRRLEIVHTNVTDAGLAHLKDLTQLRQLHIASHDTTETGLPFLGKLKELYELDLYERSASNQAVAQIGGLPKLRMFRLFGGTVDDEGLRPLADTTTLEELTLNCNRITDASVDVLASLKTLRKLSVSGTRLTDAGKQRLRAALPGVEMAP